MTAMTKYFSEETLNRYSSVVKSLGKRIKVVSEQDRRWQDHPSFLKYMSQRRTAAGIEQVLAEERDPHERRQLQYDRMLAHESASRWASKLGAPKELIANHLVQHQDARKSYFSVRA